MKYLIGLLLMVGFINARNLEACQPPNNILQQVEMPLLSKVVADPRTVTLAQSLGTPETGFVKRKTIKSFVYHNGEFTVTNSEGCTFDVSPVYSSITTPGMCPHFTGLKFSEGTCPSDEE